MNRIIIALLFVGLAVFAVAQVTVTRVDHFMVRCSPCNVGDYLVVAADHTLIGAVKPFSTQTFFGSASSPGCVAQPTQGVYKFPTAPKSIAVYRGGVRAITAGEWTLSADTLTIASPISGEQITCDYTL